MTQKYTLCPFVLSDKYHSMSAKEAKEHFDWFIKEIPSRIKQLTEVSRIITPINPWSSSSTKLFLDELSAWLIQSCEMTRLTDEDIKKQTEELAEPIRSAFQDQLYKNRLVLTPISISFCTDSTIYFNEILRSRHPNVYWGYQTQKTNAMRNMPSLLGTNDGIPSSIFGFVRDVIKAKTSKTPLNLWGRFCEEDAAA